MAENQIIRLMKSRRLRVIAAVVLGAILLYFVDWMLVGKIWARQEVKKCLRQKRNISSFKIVNVCIDFENYGFQSQLENHRYDVGVNAEMPMETIFGGPPIPAIVRLQISVLRKPFCPPEVMRIYTVDFPIGR